MRALLDTQAFLWFVLDDPKLSQVAERSISDSTNEIFISPASFWEVAIKISLGKYSLAVPYDVFWKQAIEGNAFVILPIELRHTKLLATMPFHHKDPFDRLIVAQAQAENISLISNDAELDVYSVHRMW
jgi:PIN domain nuclease of toxin-antitoxin system